MSKDIMDKIFRSDPKRNFTMFQTMVAEDSVSPSHTTESKQDNPFLGFQNCINSYPQFSGKALNLSNVNIPKTWVILDNQSTLHLFFNPDHTWIYNFISGPGVMSIHCNYGITNTKTIADVSGLDGDTLWIHPSGATSVISFFIVEKRLRIKYDNNGSVGNASIVHIGPGHGICFRQSKRGLYYYDPTDDTSLRGTIMVNTESPRMSPASAPLQEIVLVQTVEGQKEHFSPDVTSSPPQMPEICSRP